MKSIFFFIIFCLLIAGYSVFAQLPIKTVRTVSFTTEDGSNMNVDISPDGKIIVFDLLGDLYTISSKGGVASQITRGIAVNSCPVWSPNGNKIAFISDAVGDNTLTVVNASGGSRQTFGGKFLGFPVWGSQGKLISSSYPSFNKNYPLMYSLQGDSVELPKMINNIVGFSGDGNFIYFKNTNESGSSCICRYDRSSGTSDVLIEQKDEQAPFENVRISKNARWLSYEATEGTKSKLILVDLTGKTKRILAQWTRVLDVTSMRSYNFSADSKKIVIGYGGKIHLIDVFSGEDNIVPFQAQVKVDMGALNHNSFSLTQDSLQVKYLRSIHASPNGKQLVFAALGKIYIMDLPKGKPRILVNQPFNQFHPSWSPDGNWIAFVSWSDTGLGQIWKVDRNGKQLIQLTKEPGTFYFPSWSPDGSSILLTQKNYIEGRSKLGLRDGLGQGKLIKIDVNTGSKKIIADSVPLLSRPTFSTDGTQIIYTPSREGSQKTKLWPYLISKSSDELKKVLAISETNSYGGVMINESFFRQLVLSPDNKFIVFMNEENLFLVPVAETSTPTMLYDRTKKLSIIRFARGGFDPHWENKGKILSWSFGNKYYQIDPEKIILASLTAKRKTVNSDISEPEVIDVDIAPDLVVEIDLKVPRNISKGTIALTNARVVTMKENVIIEKGTLIINDGRFTSVGKNTQVKIPKDATIVNLEGKTIIPGLIDLHDHLGLPAEIFPQQKWDLQTGLAYGITTAREPSGSHDSFGYEELIESGQMTGPRLFNVGSAVREEWYPNINSLQEARVIVQNRTRMGAIVVKQYELSTRLKRQFLLMACNEAGINMTNEVEKDMNGFIGHLKDGTSGIEHNPLWSEAYNDVIQLIAKSGTYLTPTLQAPYGTQSAKYEFTDRFTKLNPKLVRFYPEKEIVSRSLQKSSLNSNEPSFLNHSKIDAAIRHAGGRVTMGSHGTDPGLGAHFEIWALQMGGLTNMKALESATIMAAGALGMQKDIGSIEPGKIADLLILNKNPLDNIQNTIEIQSVMKDGILYDGNTLDEVWPKKKKMVINK